MKENDQYIISTEKERNLDARDLSNNHEIVYSFGRKKNNAEEEEFNIYQKGQIEIAIMHRLANKPLREIKIENKNFNAPIEYCPCCGLPVKKKGYLEPFKITDDPDDFSNCSIEVSLYFVFIKFIILVMLISSIFIGLINIYYSNDYAKEMAKACDIYNQTEYLMNINYTEECKYYFSETEEDYDYYYLAKIFIFKFSSVNIKDYRDLYYEINTEKKEKKDKTFENTIINISLVNFLILFLIFIFNLFFIFFLFNKKNSLKYNNATISDYSILFYNLYDIHRKFIKEEPNEPSNESNNNQIEKFKEFMKKRIIWKNNTDKINNIVLLYKIDELMKLQGELVETEEKIGKIENDPKQIKMNEAEKLSDENRKYFENRFCSKKEEVLKTIIQEKEKIQNKIDEMIKDSEKNTLNYFGGSVIVIFNTKKEQELYLKRLPTNSIEYFINYIKRDMVCNYI